MMTVVVLPILKCMDILRTIALFILTASYHIGRIIIQALIQACDIVRDVFNTLAIIGEEFNRFLCELNASLTAVSLYVRSSANGGINCALEALTIFIKHIAKFFSTTRLHSKLLATFIGSSIRDFLTLLKNALLLIADCAWWLITLLPRSLLYALIAIGDFVVDSITSVRRAVVYSTQIIVEDVFRLTFGIVLLFVLWHNRGRLVLAILRWLLKVKRFLKLCFIRLMMIARIFRRRVDQSRTTPVRSLGVQRRLKLSRASISPSDKILDPTQRCVVCKDRQKCVLLLPCKHLCLCEECADYMLFLAQRQSCPLCRTFIDQSMSVYI